MEYLIKTQSISGMTKEQFFEFCQENRELRLERNANGDIVKDKEKFGHICPDFVIELLVQIR